MSLNIVDYSEKAIAVFGDSTPYKIHLLNLNGKFNPSLRQNDQRQAGWIFPKTKKSEVEKIINQINNGTITASEQPTEHKEYKEYKVSKNTTEKEYVSKQDFMNLVSKVERLEQEYNNLLKSIGKNPSKHTKSSNQSSGSEEEQEEEEESEEEEKPKRLLRKK
jgi:hypothetical protein